MTVHKPTKRWLSDPPDRCDLGGEPIKDVFIDGATLKSNGTMGPWGFMCPECHKIHGVGLGLGRGQEYTLQPDGIWLKTGG